VTRTGAVPPLLRQALRPTSPHCYRHCDRPLRGRSVSTPGRGWLCVYACPGGAVSVVTYTVWGGTDPTPALRKFAKAHTVPPSLVRRWDLRLATRHGPELGPAAEKFLSRPGVPHELRTVYWRLYPFKKKDGSVHRLFAQFGRGTVTFFVGPADRESPRAPAARPARSR
jgi:hypothetical protein